MTVPAPEGDDPHATSRFAQWLRLLKLLLTVLLLALTLWKSLGLA